jgi:hypothetical protein
MQQRPVIVRDNNSGTAMIALLAIVVVAAIGLFFWQPWNTTSHTTIINQQPGTSSGAGSSSGTTGTTGTSGTSGTTSGSTSGTTSGASH